MSRLQKRRPSHVAAASSSSWSSPHPLQASVDIANRSRTRKHAASYHDLLRLVDLPSQIHEPLLGWYGSRGDLPWRKDLSDEQIAALADADKAQRAYEVWVSEIMLQQTQVATVIPYYNRWMEAFPTVQVLAKADIEAVNGLWKGLGYYSRASRLLEGGKTVVNTYKGKLPSDPDILVKKIEGIGPYTAGAIASIAYGVRTPTVDGNIQRVICRLLAIHADMKKKATDAYIWQTAKDLLPKSRSGHWNQALMDLGATTCIPKNPKCKECPLRTVCMAYAEQTKYASAKRLAQAVDIEDLAIKGDECDLCLPLDPPTLERDVTMYPLKVVKKKSRDEDLAVCVVEWRSRGNDQAEKILLVKRPKTGLLAGLDEFPSVVMPESASTLSERSLKSEELLKELLHLPETFSLDSSRDYITCEVTSFKDFGSIKHIYSHINATFHCRHLVISAISPPRIRGSHDRCRWATKAEIEKANISTGAVKVWTLISSGIPVKQGKASKRKSLPEANGSRKISDFLSRKTVSVEVMPSPKRARRIVIDSDSE